MCTLRGITPYTCCFQSYSLIKNGFTWVLRFVVSLRDKALIFLSKADCNTWLRRVLVPGDQTAKGWKRKRDKRVQKDREYKGIVEKVTLQTRSHNQHTQKQAELVCGHEI